MNTYVLSSGKFQQFLSLTKPRVTLLAVFMPGVKLVGNVTTAVVLLYGGYLVLHGQMTIGTLTAFLLYLRMFFEPMQEISQFFNSTSPSLTRVLDISSSISVLMNATSSSRKPSL